MVGDRQFEHAQFPPRHPHLHFQIPAISEFAHVERQQGIAADGAQRAHVGIGDAIAEPDEGTGDKADENLMATHAARFALAAHARADDEVITAAGNGGDHVGDRRRIVGAITIHEDDDVGAIGGLRAGEASAAVAAADR